MIESVMIESVIKVVDRFSDLLKYRQERRRDLFQNLVEPLFNDLMVMHADYIKMFDDCWSQLLDNKVALQDIAASLRQRRLVYEGLRIKSRSIIGALQEYDLDDEIKKFLEAAAYHIPDGKLGPVESTPASMVLSKIYTATESLVDVPHREGNSPVGDRRRVLDLVISTCNHIRTHWAYICEEYVRVKMWSLN